MKGKCGHGFDMELTAPVEEGRPQREMPRDKNNEGTKVQHHGSGGKHSGGEMYGAEMRDKRKLVNGQLESEICLI